jgi:hypothetical protein
MPKKPEFGDLADDVPVQRAVMVPAFRVRAQFRSREVAGQAADLVVLLAHACS